MAEVEDGKVVSSPLEQDAKPTLPPTWMMLDGNPTHLLYKWLVTGFFSHL